MTATTRPHRRYTARRKAEVVGIAAVEGVTEAERETGIPKETIHYWLNKPEFAHLRTTAREIVVSQFWIGIQVGLEEVVKGLRGDAPLNHKADALRTLAERFALLNGEVTARTESLTAGMDDHERATLRSVLMRAVAEDGPA
jgi:hypothetical protein